MALVVAATCDSAPEAEIVHGRLGAEGVESFVFDTGLAGIGIRHRVRLMVDEEDLAQARRILADYPA